jgi:long-chain acyl-CoA synthetase
MYESDMLTIPAMLQASFKNFPNNQSFGFIDGEKLTYAQIEQKVIQTVIMLQNKGIKKGDRVALLSLNMPQWGIAFFSICSLGAVVVPILPDFHANEIKNILQHAEVSAVFVSETLRSKIETENGTSIFPIEDLLANTDVSNQENRFEFAPIEENDLCSIIYTSGTTGKSKGVMLSHKNIVWTAQQSWQIQKVKQSDRFLSILPLSHSFENTLGLIMPVKYGASVYYLKKPPVASVLIEALQKVKPTIMLVVPLIIEKIYKSKILSEINRRFITRNLYKIRLTRKFLNKAAARKLYETFGGKLEFFGVGGAKLDNNVEQFLMDGNFPLAIGYGMTESSPLLAGAGIGKTRFLSTGHPMEGVEIRIANADKTGLGEIQAKGQNIMLGYYKESELTKNAYTPDGWLKTGDLGCFDSDGNLYVKGRIKNMIVGASGENIYPEEIESLINRMEYVVESLVIEKKGKLVALVYLNMEELEQKYQSLKAEARTFVNDKVDDILREIQQKVNVELNKFSQIQRIILQPIPFEKTPTQKIKRFLY